MQTKTYLEIPSLPYKCDNWIFVCEIDKQDGSELTLTIYFTVSRIVLWLPYFTQIDYFLFIYLGALWATKNPTTQHVLSYLLSMNKFEIVKIVICEWTFLHLDVLKASYFYILKSFWRKYKSICKSSKKSNHKWKIIKYANLQITQSCIPCNMQIIKLSKTMQIISMNDYCIYYELGPF